MKKLWERMRGVVAVTLVIAAIALYIPVQVAGQDVNEWLGYIVFRQLSPQLRYDGTISFRKKSDTSAAGARLNLGQDGIERLAAGQTTVPTCGIAAEAQCVVDAGSDFALRGHITNPPNWKDEVVITFNTAYNAQPICVASVQTAYYYYLDSVTESTTGVTLRLGLKSGQAGGGAGFGGAGWSPGDNFKVICSGAAGV